MSVSGFRRMLGLSVRPMFVEKLALNLNLGRMRKERDLFLYIVAQYIHLHRLKPIVTHENIYWKELIKKKVNYA